MGVGGGVRAEGEGEGDGEGEGWGGGVRLPQRRLDELADGISSGES